MQKENFLFLIRVKSGELGLHQKSETRTKKHHQRIPKPFRKKAYQKQHIQAETHLSQLQLWKEAKSSEATIIWIRFKYKNHRDDHSRKKTNKKLNRTIETIPKKRGGKEFNTAQKEKHKTQCLSLYF